MNGKVCVVTGANSGIGRVAARELAAQGATVLMVCRNPEKGAEARDDIRATTGNDAVELLIADVSSRQDVKDVCADIAARYPKVDVLLNNAGVSLPSYRESVDGAEMMFAINHQGYFMMACLLAESLKAAGKARVVNVASLAHRGGLVRMNNLQGERWYSALAQYSHTKLMNILFSNELARRLEGTGVTSNALHPGVIASGFAQDEPGLMGTLAKLARPVMISPEKGAKTSIYLCTSPEVEGVTGQYFAGCKPRKPSGQARNAALAHDLWETTAALCGVDLPA